MNTPVAIVVAATIVAFALFTSILIAFRWEVTGGKEGPPFLLDRWSGQVVACTRRPEIPSNFKGGFEELEKYAPPHKPGSGLLLDCRP